MLVFHRANDHIDVMRRFVFDDFQVMLVIFGVALQIFDLVESNHDVMVDIADLENC